MLEQLRQFDWREEFKAFLKITRQPRLTYLDLNEHDFAVFMVFVMIRANSAKRIKLWLTRVCKRCKKRAYSRFPAREFNLRAEEPWGHYGYRIVPDLMVYDQNGTVAVCLEIHRTHRISFGKRRRFLEMGMRFVELHFEGVLKAALWFLEGRENIALSVEHELLLAPVWCGKCRNR